MSFRKRNVAVLPPKAPLVQPESTGKDVIPGTRPSPLDGRLTTSTGTRSLDVLLAGHAGLPLGTSMLIEEHGTTDFGGVLLRSFAAEGVVQGHHVHVLGMNQAWERDLPGLTNIVEGLSTRTNEGSVLGDKMKIAWRYERLGEFGKDRGSVLLSPTLSDSANKQPIFCHDFDLSKRLLLPSKPLLYCIPQAGKIPPDFGSLESSKSPFTRYIEHVESQVSVAPPSTIHRIVIPGLLSPAVYPNAASAPELVLQFLHSLRALLRKHSTQLIALISLPILPYPRINGLTRWIEILSDGVLEIVPFPSRPYSTPTASPATKTGHEEISQGMLKVHRLPIFNERGGGGGDSSLSDNDLAFTLSRRKGMVIKPFSLPPIDGDPDGQYAGKEVDYAKSKKVHMDF